MRFWLNRFAYLVDTIFKHQNNLWDVILEAHCTTWDSTIQCLLWTANSDLQTISKIDILFSGPFYPVIDSKKLISGRVQYPSQLFLVNFACLNPLDVACISAKRLFYYYQISLSHVGICTLFSSPICLILNKLDFPRCFYYSTFSRNTLSGPFFNYILEL